MLLYLHLAFSVVLAGLVLLCLIVAKLVEMAEAERAADRGSTSTPASDGAEDCDEFKRRARFEDGAGRHNGVDELRAESGLSGECVEEFTGDRCCGPEHVIEKENDEGEMGGRTEDPMRSRGWTGGEEDDWEGIEKTELERTFDRAVTFVASLETSKLTHGIGRDEKMKLFGFHKVATEGPCREPPPPPFKFWAQAKWNAWQQIGNMSPEDAMGRYVDIVSAISPGWMQNDPSDH